MGTMHAVLCAPEADNGKSLRTEGVRLSECPGGITGRQAAGLLGTTAEAEGDQTGRQTMVSDPWTAQQAAAGSGTPVESGSSPILGSSQDGPKVSRQPRDGLQVRSVLLLLSGFF